MEEGAEEGLGWLKGRDGGMDDFGRMVIGEHVVEVLKTLDNACDLDQYTAMGQESYVSHLVDAHRLSGGGSELAHRTLPLVHSAQYRHLARPTNG